MEIQIKRAELAEIDLLMEWRMKVLRNVFAIPENQPLEELERENRRYYQDALPLENHIACFAYMDEEIVGCGGICLYREMPSPDNRNGGCGYLMNIYTRPGSRGNGIGREVVSWLVRQAKDKGIAKIYLETSECGRRLYQEMGFCDMPDYMKLRE